MDPDWQDPAQPQGKTFEATTPSGREILVIGGGIGGLAAALAISRSGRQVRLLERSDQFGEIGAGIQLGPTQPAFWTGWACSARPAGSACYHGLRPRGRRGGPRTYRA